MSLEQYLEKLRELQISEIEGIMSSQDSPMESSISDNQEKYSGVMEDPLKQKNTSIWEEITLPIEGIIPVPITSWEVNKKSLIEKTLLQKSLLQCVQGTSSLEEWESYFKNNSEEDTFPVYWHKTKLLTRWDNATSVTKLELKMQPLKHKNLLQKPKLICILGNPKAKSLEWVKGIQRIKEENSNLLRKSKLQGKFKITSCEWLKSILNIQEENTNWARTSDISLGLQAVMIDCNNFSKSETAYNMKALTDECMNLECEKPITKYYLMSDFKALIKACENQEEEARREGYGSRYQNPNEANAMELAGYLNNSLHLPKDMSVMAESMYT